jgi:hypothetical protein
MVQPRVDNGTRRIVPQSTCGIGLRPFTESVALERTRTARRRSVELHTVSDDDPSVGMLGVGHSTVLLRALGAPVARTNVLYVFEVAHYAIIFFKCGVVGDSL